MQWFRDRSLTLVMMTLFVIFMLGQFATGWAHYNSTQREHGESTVNLASYFQT
jgi:hypothetical protein